MARQKTKAARITTVTRRARPGSRPLSEIGQRVHDRALDLNVSREVMARAVEWKPVSFRRRLREGELPAFMIPILAEILECSFEFLLVGENPPNDIDLSDIPRIQP